jgi:hypothetical protein
MFRVIKEQHCLLPAYETLLQRLVCSNIYIIFPFNCSCAYVIPTFEVSDKKPFPETKALLLDYWNNDNARPFLSGPTVSSPAHSATNYDTYVDRER